jgi:FolB domain-containing protein
MEDYIDIKNIEVSCIVGINPEEKIKKQPLIINLTLYVSFFNVSDTDNVEDTVDYSSIASDIKDFVSKSKFNLIETLATKIARNILTNEKIKKVKVEVIKPLASSTSENISVVVTRESF